VTTKPDHSPEQLSEAGPDSPPADGGTEAPPPTLTSELLEITPQPKDEPQRPQRSLYAEKLMSPRRRKVEQGKRKRRRLTRRQRRQRQRLQILAATFVTVAAIWMTLTATTTHVEPLPVLTLGDLPRSGALRGVVARPPSLFVDVHQRTWGRLSPEQRLSLVEEVGAKAEAAGYSGALFRTSQGLSVAEWMSTTGARVFKQSGSPS
jgi:hypothetical protein